MVLRQGIPVLLFSINALKTNGRLFYLKAQSVPRCKHSRPVMGLLLASGIITPTDVMMP